MSLRKWFLYITNNEEVSRHEQGFDIAFFIINTAALVFGTAMFIIHKEAQWIPVLVIEYTWALDSMRHNRP
ncbi:MAG: hypothetical protein G01um101413_477 [Parcubacteria group bacterium Gr01-1014_13]|nr:MAG: hypothetical protein G01um101413_477 [Parcubacteria group bacterium Gr01-1014_13]